MTRIKSLLLSSLLLLLLAKPAQAEKKAEFAQHVYNSVVLLYSQTEDGGMKMHCTATAYRVVTDLIGSKKTRFVSASHCVSGENSVEQKQTKFFITADAEGEKTFIPATLVEAGDRKVGDDFAIFEVQGAQFDSIPLGDSDKIRMGDSVLDVASPLGLGKQYFEGYVSSIHLDRPPLDAGDVQWTNVMLVEIGGGPGSSGSSIISLDQHAIVGFLVGAFSGGNIGAVCIPVDKFKAFEAAVDKGIYKKTPTSEHRAMF